MSELRRPDEPADLLFLVLADGHRRGGADQRAERVFVLGGALDIRQVSDEVTCTAVLQRNAGIGDTLYLAVPPDWRLRVLPCREKGRPKMSTPEWEWERLPDGRLQVTPSLLATDTGFHTAGVWQCKYVEVALNGYTRFQAENPTINIHG